MVRGGAVGRRLHSAGLVMIECYARGKFKVQNRKLQLLQRSMPRPGHVAGLPVGYLCAVLACLPSACAASNAVIWERGDQIVQLVRQDDDAAAPNDHPTSITPDEIEAMLEGLRLHYADELGTQGTSLRSSPARTPAWSSYEHLMNARRYRACVRAAMVPA